jgi:hypothetical protein
LREGEQGVEVGGCEGRGGGGYYRGGRDGCGFDGGAAGGGLRRDAPAAAGRGVAYCAEARRGVGWDEGGVGGRGALGCCDCAFSEAGGVWAGGEVELWNYRGFISLCWAWSGWREADYSCCA